MIAADLVAFLDRGRAMTEELMPDRVRLYRPGPDEFDRETGGIAPGPPLGVFYGAEPSGGPARVRAAQIAANQVQSGETELQLRQYLVKLPFGTVLPAGERPEPGDRLDVLATADPRMAGLRLWVVSMQYGSTASAYKIVAETRQEGQQR
jgi:hypothetical protein